MIQPARLLEKRFGEFFDIMPEIGAFYLNTLNPVYKVRLKFEGLKIISEYYNKEYGINISIKKIQIPNCSLHYMCYDDAVIVYSQLQNFIAKKIFQLSQEGQTRALLIDVRNKEGLTKHVIPIILHKNATGVDVFFLDKFFTDRRGIADIHSGSCYGLDTVYQLSNVVAWMHKDTIQYDMHSCTVLGLKMVKKLLKNDGQELKKLMKSSIPRTVKKDDGSLLFYNEFQMPDCILAMAQTKKIESQLAQELQYKQEILFNYNKPYLYDGHYPVKIAEVQNVKITNGYLDVQGYKYVQRIINECQGALSNEN